MKSLLSPTIAILFLVASVFAAPSFHWPDRRPIATIFLATSAQNWPANPRGYFNDPNLDVHSPEGRAELRSRMMALADATIARIRDVGAQGVIVWDIEGGEMPHAITYLGDPRVLPRVAPEMDAIADEFFAKFREAGVPTGICIRPSSIVFANEGDYPWIQTAYGHTDGEDPVGVLDEKIKLAKKRWGCTIFYIDTNFTPKRENGEMVRKPSGTPEFRKLTSEEMAELAKRHPDSLIWPEFSEPDYFASVSSYGEFHRVGDFSKEDRTKYPEAFRVWMSRMQPEDIYASWDAFISNGMETGEVFLFECAPSMSPMGDLLKNAQDELALRREKDRFTPASETDALIRQLQTESRWAARRMVVDALGKSASPEATSALASVLKEEINGLQWFAASALAKQGTPEAIAVLQEAVEKRGDPLLPSVRALGQTGKKEVAQDLIPLLKSSADPSIRWAAIDALGELRDSGATEPLLVVMKSLEGTAAMRSREKVVAALGKIGDSRATPALEAALQSPEYAKLQKPVRAALAQINASTNP